MSARFDELAAQRDPLYAATMARTLFLRALVCDEDAEGFERAGYADRGYLKRYTDRAYLERQRRDAWLLKLAIRALRNETL